MIPLRLKLSGFLSYAEERELDFTGTPVWLLTGPNGSGKSSVFDALTYALFGYHRAGSQNAAELINKDSKGFVVEFDFALADQQFRIKRTYKITPQGNTSSTFQLSEFAHGQWEPVPDTSKKTELDRWISDHLGLDYESFTSSVLLLQGKSEKLLESKPSGRAEILAKIVDLVRFQKLHESANARKLQAKVAVESLTHQTDAVPEVGEEEFSQAEAKLAGSRESLEDAKKTLAQWQARAVQVQRWIDAEARLESAKNKLTAAERLLGDAVRIEKEYERLLELRTVRPTVEIAVTERTRIADSQRRFASFEKNKTDAEERKATAEHERSLLEKQLETLQHQREKDESRRGVLEARLRELSGLLKTVQLAETQTEEIRIRSEELAKLPANPVSERDSLQAELDRLGQVSQLLPILRGLHQERNELAAVLDAEKNARVELEKLKKAGEEAKKSAAAQEDQLKAAEKERVEAERIAGAAEAVLEAATKAAAEFARQGGEKNCSACGQELTADHYAKETRKRTQAIKAAEKESKSAGNALETARKSAAELQLQVENARKKLEELRQLYRDTEAKAKTHADTVKRLKSALELKYRELPTEYRTRISPKAPDDWTKTTFPEANDLETLTSEASRQESVRKAHRKAQDNFDKWNTLQAAIANAKSSLVKLQSELPAGDPQTLRTEQRSKQAEEKSLKESLAESKKLLAELTTNLDKRKRDIHESALHIANLDGNLRTEETTQKNSQSAIDNALSQLSDAWRVAVAHAGVSELSSWRSELETLTAAGTESKAKQLVQARGGLAALQEERQTCERAIAAVPEEARLSPEQLASATTAAQATVDTAEAELREALQHKATLEGHRAKRESLGKAYREADALFTRWKVLSEYLDREHLQRYLVRQAERQIVDCANSILDRLSAGTMALKLVGGEDSEKALDLECFNRATGGTPINVAFLSGSQRFRVAVSLALGIGQFAGNRHRPIETVIIDEGFGSLDRTGRQVMIQELLNLRGHLACILLVSHQEEFADAFPDGYRFELVNGGTQVTRFRKGTA